MPSSPLPLLALVIGWHLNAAPSEETRSPVGECLYLYTHGYILWMGDISDDASDVVTSDVVTAAFHLSHVALFKLFAIVVFTFCFTALN